MRVMGRHIIIAVAAMVGLAGRAPAADPDADVTLLYFERPPLHFTDSGGHPAGTQVEATSKILAAAGLSYTWKVRPAKRILHDVYEAVGNVCSPGWFHTQDRSEKAIFSEPLVKVPPLIGVVNEQSKAQASADAFATLSAMRTILVRDNLVHGAYLEGLLARLSPEHIIHRSTIDVPGMLAMVTAHHVDMAIMSEEEANYYISVADRHLSIARFTNMAPGEGRHLLCGKQTDPDIVARINAAILQGVK